MIPEINYMYGKEAFIPKITYIGTDVHYPIPPHHQKAFSELKDHTYPISEQIHRTVVSIPCGLHLEESEVEYITECINNY